MTLTDEQSRPPFNKPSAVPKEFAWPSLLARVARRPSWLEELASVVAANLQRVIRFRRPICQRALTG